MRPLSVLVVDDEPLAVSQMRWLLDAEPQAGEVFAADSARAAEAMLESGKIDVVLLDIHMPGTNGLDFARGLHDVPIIFVTADARPAVEAFELRACDYLLKPVRARRLSEAMRRAAESLSTVSSDEARVAVLQGGATVLLDIPHIRWILAQGDYVRLFTAGHSYLLRATLADLEEDWDQYGFLRIHRSHMVNIRRVKRLLHREGKLSLDLGDVQLEVSRRLAAQVRRRLDDQ